jgi:dipeptidyl aminopeptidase/acylaminoacyl peptidase
MQRFLFHRPAFQLLLFLVFSSAAMFPHLTRAEDPLDAPFQRPRGPAGDDGVYKERIVPHWLAGGAAFWYRDDLPRGKREFILIDAVKGVRAPAFDHAKLAASLKAATGKGADSERLALEALEFDLAENKLLFRTNGKDWRCDLATYELAEVADRKLPPAEEEPAADERPGRRFRRRDGEDGPRPARDRSPDGKWTAFIREHNVFIRSPEDEKEIALTQDGREGLAYGMLEWSPDSKTLVAFRIEPGEQKEVFLIESSPRDGGRAKMHKRPYDLPGDRFASYELHLFDIENQKEIQCAVEKIDFGFPRLHWRRGGSAFAYEKFERGHQRFRLIEVDARTGASRNLIEETSPTFIWSAHTEAVGVRHVTWVEKTDEIVFASERDGWRHLYLVDASEGKIVNPITHGEWVVRGVDRIDEENRQIWFRASGVNPDQDPYFIHFYRINFDGTGLLALTAGNGTHTLQYSPDRQFVIDTYSRVDLAPVHELRRISDGQLVCELERADVSEVRAAGWRPPEVFSAKGRDGKTDIWGIICRPRNFDPTKTYPVIEDIYAGPQSAFVPKSFSARDRYRSLNDLGFVVVKIDGMGTAHRSKAFHDVCWKNLKDAGFEDRIRWMQAAAAKDPALDLNRVGVFGTSAGGQNAAGALLFHPEFYKVAVANCGCHDNRMDKASWNEQWMGHPVGQCYSECSNIDNASRLKGKLFLIVGEMDNNVPPESTYRFADALIKARKDFDFLVVPGGGHGAGGAYVQRRLEDFFVRHLQGREPPDRNGGETYTAAESAPADEAAAPAALDLKSLQPTAGELAAVVRRYEADRDCLARHYGIRESPVRQERMRKFLSSWLEALRGVDTKSLTEAGRTDLTKIREDILRGLDEIERDAAIQKEIAGLIPFAPAIIRLFEARQTGARPDAPQTAGLLDEMAGQIERLTASAKAEQSSTEGRAAGANAPLVNATRAIAHLRTDLGDWFKFYDGYDPEFTWWMKEPFKNVDEKLQKYAAHLESQLGAAQKSVRGADSSGSGAANTSSESLSAAEDLPDLARLMAAPVGRLQPVIEKFASERRRIRSERPARQADAPAQSGERRGDRLRGWQVALEQLEFDAFGRPDQVDFLLLKNHVIRELRRLEGASNPPAATGGLPTDESAVTGRPIGREALLVELAQEMIPYTPEELIAIARREYAWCETELKKCSQAMGFGDDWQKAVEKVKTMHVAPGEQPRLIRELAREAIDYVLDHDLVTVPALASETWGMRMMSPQRQLVNPFFTGGEIISVSYPTDAMPHDAKLQSMRGNNIPFARATVHHELIPGHHLQGFMASRERPYRGLFATPFWGEGWALYWEMLLYDRGFAKTPEDRVGFLVWRAHRCARIIYSLGFHLGEMSPQECIDLLVARVGFDRKNAEAEVRRSFGTAYGPLYQAAYMTGGLQFRALHRELVESGKMTDRAFHDAILRENSMPVELVRALLTDQPLTRDFRSTWRFYDAEE